MLKKSELKRTTRDLHLYENSLYHYVHEQNECRELYSLNVSRCGREALYINLPTAMDKKLCSHDWELNEQHLTIDKYINDELTFFSTSHFTQTYTCKSQGNQRATVHVYFDREGNINPHIFIRVKDIETEQPLEDRHTFLVNQVAVMEQVTIGQTRLLDMIEKQMSYFKILSKDCHEIDHSLALSNQELFTALTNEKPSIISRSIRISQDYIALLDKLTLYSNNPLERTSYSGKKSYLIHLIERLEHKSAEVSPPSLSSSKHGLPDEKIELNESCRLAPSLPVSKPTKCDTEKHALSIMIDLFLSSPKESNTVTYITSWHEIDNELLELELSYPAQHVQQFINDQRARLPAVNLHDLFLMLCKTSSIDHVAQTYPSILCKIDMMSLFSEIHEKIISKDESMGNLIQLADFFYEHSTEYQTYILVERIKFFKRKESFGHIVSPLILSCATNNFPAFQMYLRQGRSIHAAHLFEGGFALNALQVIVLLSNMLLEHMDITTLKRYIDALFQHGAKLTTPVLLESHTNYFMDYKNTTPQKMSSLVNTIQDQYRKKATDKPSRQLEKRKHHPSIAKSLLEQEVTPPCNLDALQRIHSIPNILQLSVTLGLNQTYHHEVIGQIASYSDLKVCLNAMIAFLNTGHFTRLLSTYHEGKITFFKTEEEMAAYISECQEHFNPHFKTFQFVYSFHKGTLPELINKEDIMLKLEYLTRRFEALYLPLSDESKRAVIKELKAEAIKTQLAKQNHTDRFVAVEAVLLALTYISEPSTDDFIQLVKLSIMSLKISLEPLDKNSMGYSLCGHLLNKINRLSQNMPEDAQEAIRALKEYIELGRMVSEHQPIPQISFFRPSAQPSMAVQEQQRDQHASVIH